MNSTTKTLLTTAIAAGFALSAAAVYADAGHGTGATGETHQHQGMQGKQGMQGRMAGQGNTTQRAEHQKQMQAMHANAGQGHEQGRGRQGSEHKH